MDLRAGVDDVEKRKFFTLPELELWPFGRPARNQSLYRLRYPCSFLRPILILSSHLCLGLRSCFFPTEILCAIFFSTSARCLDLLILIVRGEEYKLWSSSICKEGITLELRNYVYLGYWKKMGSVVASLISAENSTTKFAHHFHSRGYRTYWQEPRINITVSLDVLCQVRYREQKKEKKCFICTWLRKWPRVLKVPRAVRQ
jgi:hypothetical protein